MAEFLRTNDFEDEDPYVLPRPDNLGVLGSTRQVVEKGEYVWIDFERLNLLAHQWLQEERSHPFSPPSWYEHYHFFDGTWRSANWILALDAMNFCFWSQNNRPRWSVEYAGERLNGYMAEAASLKRAVEEGIPLWDAAYLSDMDARTLAHIFRGQQTIPLFEQRLENLREVGQVLSEKYDGQCIHLIEEAGGSAVKQALAIVQSFPSFNDSALYHNDVIRFFKRAQLCVADLHAAFGDSEWGAFTDMDQLTAFADYKLPQVLRHLGALDYHPSLAERIDEQALVEAGSEEEIEIRAATIWACEFLRRELLREGLSLTAAEIDLRLWLMGQQAATMRPYHRTRTIYY
jgi:hypothetical protein